MCCIDYFVLPYRGIKQSKCFPPFISAAYVITVHCAIFIFVFVSSFKPKRFQSCSATDLCHPHGKRVISIPSMKTIALLNTSLLALLQSSSGFSTFRSTMRNSQRMSATSTASEIQVLNGVRDFADNYDIFLLDMWGVMHVSSFGISLSVKMMCTSNKWNDDC